MRRAALLFGIDHYKTTPLKSCINDANILSDLLERHEDLTLNFFCKKFTSDFYKTLHREFMMKEIGNFFSLDLEVAILYFSGHGASRAGQGYIIPLEAEDFEDYIPMTDLVSMASQSLIKNIIIILDCSYSGNLGNTVIDEFGLGSVASIPEGLILMTSSGDSGHAKSVGGRGVFSKRLTDGLEGEAADLLGRVSILELFVYVDQISSVWDSRPTFKMNIDRNVILRQCNPRVDIFAIRQLLIFFKTIDSKFQLDPSFEPTSENADTENVKKFQIIQRLNNGSLVKPSAPYEHMYFAALEGGTIELTELGRFYWQLAGMNKI
ncbi:MAG: caspase family protein [Bacteroidia bacterium]|nr:caspase family protein [Bacteroidia bacterium]